MPINFQMGRRRESMLAAPRHRLALGGVAMLLLLIWAPVAWLIDSDYRLAVDRSYEESNRGALKLANVTGRSIDQVRTIAALVKHLYERDGTVDFKALDAAGLLGDPASVIVIVIDAKGGAIVGSRPQENLNFADRDYFKAARDHAGFVTTAPIIGRVTKRWTVPTAIRMNASDGTFNGVVYVGFEAAMLTRGFNFDDAPDTIVGVIGRDGIYRSRLAGTRQSTGDRIDPALLLKNAAVKTGARRSGPLASPIDGVLRFPASVPVPGTDLFAVVSTGAREALRSYGQRRSELLAFGGLASAVVLVVAWMLLMQAARLRASEEGRRRTEARHRAELETQVKARTAQLTSSNETLLRTQEETRSILESMADGVVTVDELGSIRSANSMLLAIFGYRADEVLGRNVSLLIPDLTAERWRPRHPGKADDKGGHGADYRNCIGIQRDGARIDIEVALSECEANGQRWHTAVVRDVRERLRAMADLDQARLDAEQASRAKSTFVANMSHELRTPMNGVIGMIDVLCETPLKEEQLEMLSVARESARALMEIVEDVLDFSKIEAGRIELDHAAISISGICEELHRVTRTSADSRGVATTLFVDPRIPAEVVGDGVKVRQVLVNLVGNAIKFSSGKGITGSVDVRALLLDDANGRALVEFSVADNGIGMDGATLGRLYAPFTQADASTTRRFGGTGLGLVITRELVRKMGGEIAVESAPGMGSTFTVRLPFAIEAKADAIVPPAPLAGVDILISGEQVKWIEIVRTYFQHAGATVALATSLDADIPEPTLARDRPLLHVVVAADAVERIEGFLERSAGRLGPRPRCLAVVADQRRPPASRPKGFVALGAEAATFSALTAAATAALGDLRAAPPVVPLRARQDRTRDTLPVLVAEDNEMNRAVIAHQLQALGYSHQIARNGVEALALCRIADFAMLLTDLQMPEMDGYSLARQIRAGERPGRRMPIVALSANATKHEGERCFAEGMDDYATKPIALDSLGALLARWIPSADPASGDDEVDTLDGRLHPAP